MKAYQIKIILEESEPLIWRRVVVPAGITFDILHNIIQVSMGWGNIQSYDFNIEEEKLRITSDAEAIAEYEFYSKAKAKNKDDPNGFIAHMLEMKPKLSSKANIDEYFIKGKNIQYIYDFGDYWKHDIIIEEILENYKCNYPVCIGGEGACPPEDVGGIPGYMEFLEIIKDRNNPEYEATREWSNNQNYKYTFDIKATNMIMAEMFK